MCGREEFFSFLAEISRKIEKKKSGIGNLKVLVVVNAIFCTLLFPWTGIVFAFFLFFFLIFYSTLLYPRVI